jgi:hypothetical protein
MKGKAQTFQSATQKHGTSPTTDIANFDFGNTVYERRLQNVYGRVTASRVTRPSFFKPCEAYYG